MLDVPFVTQMKVGAHAGGNYYNDTTGCWYAGICMIAYYYAPGPRQGVPAQFTISKFTRDKDDKVTKVKAIVAEPMGARYEELMANEGLATVPLPGGKQWTCESLCDILATKGPCFVRRGFRNKTTGVLTGGHIIVLVGCKISSRKVYYHCPTKGPSQEVTIEAFNDMFKWDDPKAAKYSMMCKPNASAGSSVKDLVRKFT